ncbi:MAG: topoisomerase IV [Ruminococcaceae bacterium]|nr:topoisomerase IV [Oscillospiraceae bacterium]
MARKKKTPDEENKAAAPIDPNAHIAGAGEVANQFITDTLEVNYMPYAMSVIMSRAIPEIDGFKPSHRKLLYTMYKMGLLTGARSKSANIVGATMKLNPHGDMAIYETMVRLTKGNEALLHPYVDSKGNFGKAYSKNMQFAASRYTEAKLAAICGELFADIDKDAIDFVPNYDNTMPEPVLFPVTFPSVLVNSNSGIAVGMASNICSFNLREVCETTIALIKNPDHDCTETLKAPDFSGGGSCIYDPVKIREVYATGRGSIKVRGKCAYDKKNNCIDITEIPPTTTCEAIIDKIIELVKGGKLREISDVRDETDRSGLKITVDLKRGADADKVISVLFKKTPLEDPFPCNFNVLIGGTPMTLGVADLLSEWIAFRTECVRRRTYFELKKAKDRLHLLKALQKILLDIDKAIKIIRQTEEESDVVPNLMIGFGIDEIQAEYVAEIKLRHLNREYILRRLEDIEKLEAQIEDLEDVLNSKNRIKKIIIEELKKVADKYGMERKTDIIYESELEDTEEEEEIPDYSVMAFFTKEGYFKKISHQSWRMGNNHKLKDGDEIIFSSEVSNNAELLFFTNKNQCYKSRVADFEECKASVLGDFVAAKLQMDDGETAIFMAVVSEYKGYILVFFENGKVAKIDASSYETKTNRKKLIKAYSDKSEPVAFRYITVDAEFIMSTTAGRYLCFNSGAISSKSAKDTQGVAVMTLKKGHKVISVEDFSEDRFKKPARYRTKTLPSAGAVLSADDQGEQLSMTDAE